jgi:hypothetical protein
VNTLYAAYSFALFQGCSSLRLSKQSCMVLMQTDKNPRGKLHDGEFTHRVTKSDTGPFPFQMI